MKILRLFNNTFFNLASWITILAVATSCERTYVGDGNPVKPAPSKEQELAAIKKVLSKVPKLVITKPEKGKGGLRIGSDGYSFVDPGPGGFNFSSPSGYVWNNSSGTLYVAASSFGANSGGNGTIQLGSTTWPITHTFCFAAEEDFFGAGIFGDESLYDGVAGVIGINGDFNRLMEGGDDMSEFVKVIAMYFVYAKRASGNYPIVNFLDLEEENNPQNTVRNKGFALAFDYKNKRIYISKEGRLQVSGGSMNFTGKYYEADLELEDDMLKIVNGLGVMGCQ